MKIFYLVPLSVLLLTGCVTRTYTIATPQPGPSLAEVQSMVQAKVSDSVIVNQIQSSSTIYHLTAEQIIALKTAGAGDSVINALITSANKVPVQSTTTTVVQEPYVYPSVYVDPWPVFWWGPYYHGYYHGGYWGGGWHGGGSWHGGHGGHR